MPNLKTAETVPSLLESRFGRYTISLYYRKQGVQSTRRSSAILYSYFASTSRGLADSVCTLHETAKTAPSLLLLCRNCALYAWKPLQAYKAQAEARQFLLVLWFQQQRLSWLCLYSTRNSRNCVLSAYTLLPTAEAGGFFWKWWECGRLKWLFVMINLEKGYVLIVKPKTGI